jgi:hypothetical protein
VRNSVTLSLVARSLPALGGRGVRAREAGGADKGGLRAEFVDLVRRAGSRAN